METSSSAPTITVEPFSSYASILFDVAIDKTLDYGIPEKLQHAIVPGVRVEAPIKGKLQGGYVLNIKGKSDYPHVKAIFNILPEELGLPKDLFELALWMSKYYATPLRKVLKVILPGVIRKPVKPKQQFVVMRAKTKEEIQGYCIEIRNRLPAQASVLEVMLMVTKEILLSELLDKTKGSRSPVDSLVKKGFLAIDIVRVDRSPLTNEEYFRTKPRVLTSEQSDAYRKVLESLTASRFQTHLLHGVTGSGKTEIYLQTIEKALELGKGTIVLVPEISLTAQTIERFRSRFEGHIAILHHRLSHGERCDEWQRIRQGRANIVIGARSAIFSPVQNLGLIIVDEEHESSYKQGDEMPCYHARDIAVMRGKIHNAAVILGSATPSLESYYNAQIGKYSLSLLKTRADIAASLPGVHIVDMQQEFKKSQGYTCFSELLLDGIKKRHQRGEQTILFLNRRGYHTSLLCPKCQHVVSCIHCDTTMTFHLGDNSLSCHLCGFSHSPPPSFCEQCNHPEPMKYRGIGTEKVEKMLQAIFPDIRTLRVDADTTKHKGSHQKLLRAFGSGKADVLIGTQMIAKGLHFPSVSLVGILNADAALQTPDFRASENAFQMMTQVAGRAGRGAIPGEVIIQTGMPENNVIQLAATQDYEQFYQAEIEIRENFYYPPFCQLAKVTAMGKNPIEVRESLENIRKVLIRELPEAYHLHPVLPCGHAKVKDKYRFQFLIRGPAVYPIVVALDAAKTVSKTNIQIKTDINPTSTYF